jgi:ABC-2 type transport system permease protein
VGTWWIASKDLRLLVRDRHALVVLLAMPLVFIAIIGFSVGKLTGWQSEKQGLKMAVVDEAGGELSRQVVAALEKRDGVRVETVADRAEAVERLDRHRADVAVLIGRGFSSRVEVLQLGDVLDTRHGPLAGGIGAFEIEVVQQNSFVNVRGIAEQIVYAEVVQTVAPHVARKLHFAQKLLDQAEQRHLEEATRSPVPKPAAVVPSTRLTYQQLVPAYTVLFVFFLITVMARSFLGERDQGTLRRLRMAPLRPYQLLVGKTLPFYLLSLTQTALLFLAGRYLFGMECGSKPWLLVPTVLCTSLAATALGLMTATFVRTDAQVSGYTIFLVLTMGAVSGCLMPRELLPFEMQQVSLTTPHAWALMAFEQILRTDTPDIEQVARCCAALLLFALLFFSVGCQRFRRLEGTA